jgi:ABC-type sugar transport system ATPase subunit
MPEPLLEMSGISKSFGGNPVLSGVDLTLFPHEVHAVVGENGAGKSTLMKILNGVYTMDGGEIKVAGQPLTISSPHDARRVGIRMIFQEQTVANDLTVAENIFLGMEPERARGIIDNARMNQQATEVLHAHRFPLNPNTRVSRLTRAERQLVEIARALAGAARIVVMDEPTAVLSHGESEELFRIIGELKQRGLAVVYISHRMEELARISDRITILRDGRRVFTSEYASVDQKAIIRYMVGRDIHELYPKLPEPGSEVILSVRNLSLGRQYRDISFDLHRGEILGLAGLVGAGRTAVARGIFGLESSAEGIVFFGGRLTRFATTSAAIAAGFGYVTEDRKAVGIFPDLSVAHNISIAALNTTSKGPVIQLAQEIGRCRELIRKLGIRARSEWTAISRLSGGNQQKALLARWLFAGTRILLLDEPTQGVDLATRPEIYRLMTEIVSDGGAILMISSDLPELLGMSHRIGVMRRGQLVAMLSAAQTNQEEIMNYAALERQ